MCRSRRILVYLCFGAFLLSGPLQMGVTDAHAAGPKKPARVSAPKKAASYKAKPGSNKGSSLVSKKDVRNGTKKILTPIFHRASTGKAAKEKTTKETKKEQTKLEHNMKPNKRFFSPINGK